MPDHMRVGVEFGCRTSASEASQAVVKGALVGNGRARELGSLRIDRFRSLKTKEQRTIRRAAACSVRACAREPEVPRTVPGFPHCVTYVCRQYCVRSFPHLPRREYSRRSSITDVICAHSRKCSFPACKGRRQPRHDRRKL